MKVSFPIGRVLTYVLIVVSASLLLVGCTVSAPLLKLDGVWGGVLRHAGVDYFAFALDVQTSSSGTVSGIGVLTNDGVNMVWFTVTGTTTTDSMELAWRDAVNDIITLSGSRDGALIRGTWVYPPEQLVGSFRMAAENNVHLLSQAGPLAPHESGRLRDLLR